MKLQFRLRTLMIAVTLLAVPLGYVGWQAKIVRERDACVASIGKLNADWRELAKRQQGRNGRDQYYGSLRLLAEMVETRWSREQRGGCIRFLRDNESTAAELSGLRNALAQALVRTCVKLGERHELVELLSFDCPKAIGTSDIEFYLAYDSRLILPDGIIVLMDAYACAVNEEKKGELATYITRSFRGAGVRSDGKYPSVSACRDWYGSNRERLAPNPAYGELSDSSVFDRDPYADVPLFVSKK